MEALASDLDGSHGRFGESAVRLTDMIMVAEAGAAPPRGGQGLRRGRRAEALLRRVCHRDEPPERWRFPAGDRHGVKSGFLGEGLLRNLT